MKVIDLFSGIGGFSLGLESTGGFETVQFVENNKWCQKVLAKNFSNVPITGDIRNYEGQEQADVVVGGFPCQPFSVAGKRKGTEDDRHLWPEMLRVIKASKPRWVIGENVRNLTSIQEGMVFEQVCTDLENEGYEVQSFIIPASAVNAPHQRYRVWIVAYSESSKSRKQTEWKRGQDTERGSDDSRRVEREGSENVANAQCDGLTSTKKRRSTKETIRQESQGENRTLDSQGASGLSETTKNVANSESSNRNDHETVKKPSKAKTQEVSGNRDGIRATQGKPIGKDVSDSNSEGLQGLGESSSKLDKEITPTSYSEEQQRGMDHERFSVEPGVGRVVNGISNRVDRIKGLGNAIVPQIAYQIGLAILEAEKK
jgi:DNA (cytosine-5)-methyltransferase 1